MTETSPTPLKSSLWGSSPVVLGLAPIGTRVLPFSSFPPELASEVLKFAGPAEILAMAQMNRALHAMVVDAGSWERWVQADPTDQRFRKWNAAADFAASRLSVPKVFVTPQHHGLGVNRSNFHRKLCFNIVERDLSRL